MILSVLFHKDRAKPFVRDGHTEDTDAGTDSQDSLTGRHRFGLTQQRTEDTGTRK